MKKSEFIQAMLDAVALVNQTGFDDVNDPNWHAQQNWHAAGTLVDLRDQNGSIAKALEWFAANTNSTPNQLVGLAKIEAAWDEYQAQSQANPA